MHIGFKQSLSVIGAETQKGINHHGYYVVIIIVVTKVKITTIVLMHGNIKINAQFSHCGQVYKDVGRKRN